MRLVCPPRQSSVGSNPGNHRRRSSRWRGEVDRHSGPSPRRSCARRSRQGRLHSAFGIVMPTPATESLSLPILGMTCASCQHHVETALRATAGVQSAHVDLMGNRATIEYDPAAATPDKLVEAIHSAGYDAVLPRSDTSGGTPPADTPTTGPESKAIVALAAGAAEMLLAMPLDAEMGPLDHALMRLVPWLYTPPTNLIRWTLLILTAR